MGRSVGLQWRRTATLTSSVGIQVRRDDVQASSDGHIIHWTHPKTIVARRNFSTDFFLSRWLVRGSESVGPDSIVGRLTYPGARAAASVH
jgi:hypothetical protein